ncbi:COMPASS complex protein [Mycena sanguinolenta]|uniref:COMPASS complex protein n=1 Tax=Mycena sanguinolenta TaxID=230812 RepID=A0A8H7D5R5_9AGAR|nr:COMPASS complex protein [Mycena sanguinolenta]
MSAEPSYPPPAPLSVSESPPVTESTPVPVPAPVAAPVTQTTQSRKRKRAPATAASPAPSDSTNGNAAPEYVVFYWHIAIFTEKCFRVLSSRADLSTRPRLSISRGPNFLPTTEGSRFFKTELTGVNRIGYRYTPAGINPPGHFLPCRTIESNPTAYRISWEDRSSFVAVTKDGLELAGSTGFRSARCNAPIREGKWYMEVKIVRGGGEHSNEDGKREGSHVRLGWGRREAPLNGPVGLDGYSYGYRDKTGDKVTLSRPRPYGRPFFTGDVIGMYISLPPKRQANPKDLHDPARLKRERIAIDLKGQEVFEILEYPQSKEMAALMDYSGKSSASASIPSSSKKIASGKLPERGPSNAPKTNTANLRPLPTLPDSHIAFFVNGECQGIAFQDLYDYLQLRQTNISRKAKDRKRTREGVKEHTENPFDDGTLGYYPFISLFNEASVKLNPGPTFDFPPPARY